jgi:hypothetical protein
VHPSPGQVPDSVKAFWAPIIKEDPTPIIAYADAVFLIDSSADLFRYHHGASNDRGAAVDPHLARQFASNAALVTKAGPLYYDNGYTGTGDLEAVARLTGFFTQMGARPIIESSFNISTNDLKEHDVILLGSPFQNVAAEQLPPSGDFVFVSSDSLWGGYLVNTHPQPGEKSMYKTERDPATQAVKVDYAVISFQPGIVPGRHIISLGGLDTKGTEGAVLLASSEAGVEGLSKFMAANDKNSNNETHAFQALLRIDLEKGYQVLDTQLLAIHTLNTKTPPVTKSSVLSP